AITGALSTEVVESGPFTSLEQAMLATEMTGRTRVRGFGVYNAVATAAGSLGALAATLPGLVRDMWSGAPADERWFWLFVPAAVGLLFFAFGVLQTASFLAAPRLAERFGLLSTMVFTHLPSNLLLVAVAFAPNLAIAVALLLARVALSQMDVPTRQAYVMALVEPEERTAAAAYTNTVRYIARPVGP